MFKVTTRFEADKVRNYCIKNDFYNCGDCEEYAAMLGNVREHEINPEIADVAAIAEDIYTHSALDASYDGYAGTEIIESIIFGLLNECMTRFVESV